MACQMGLRRLFADKRRCAVSDRMTLGAVLVTVFTLLVFDLVLRRPETSATFLPILLEIFSSGGGRNPIGRRTESDRTADGIRSGGGRNSIGRRTESDWTADAARRKAQEKRLRLRRILNYFCNFAELYIY